MPSSDDEHLGISFFRDRVWDEAFENLTLPRIFASRSDIQRVSFRATDLSESSMCWNDFIDVKFDHALLIGADLRASIFEGVSFRDADLSSADLRHAQFKECAFEGANMKGAKLTRERAMGLYLSPEQQAAISWQDSDGAEPEGG